MFSLVLAAGVAAVPAARFGGMWVLAILIAALGGGVALLAHHTGSSQGFASHREMAASMSAHAMRRSARLTRPSLKDPRRAAATECGIYLGRARRLFGRRAWATLEDVILLLGPARKGKTAFLAGSVLDAPGAALVTSTKADICRYTAERRRRTRGPVYVFNPEGLGGREVRSTLRWSPIVGCERPAVAIRRAGYLLAGSPAAK